MKKFSLLLLMTAMYFSVFAQPSAETMKAKVKSELGSSVKSVELIDTPTAENEYENGAWKYKYRHRFIAIKSTNRPGITYKYISSIQYVKTGNTYSFDQILGGSGEFLGVPEPDKKAILEMLHNNLSAFLESHNYNSIVGDVSEITFPVNPEWKWSRLTSVNFKVLVTYSKKIGDKEVETAIHTYKVDMISDTDLGKFKRFNSSEANELNKVISTKKYDQDEYDKLKSLAEIDMENQAKKEMSQLPDVGEIPVFESDKQLFYFIHEKILTEPTDRMLVYIYKLIDSDAYQANSKVLLTAYYQGWMDKLKVNHDAYKAVYCQYPAVKRYQAGWMSFWDKENLRDLNIKGKQVGNTWKLMNIDFYPAPKADMERMKTIKSSCLAKPDLTVRKSVSYSVGDKVFAKFSNGTFPAIIDKKDPNYSTRYFVKLESSTSGKGYWMEEILLLPRTGNEKAPPVAESQSKTFALGDKVQVNTSAGWLKGEIIQVLGKKMQVKFDNTRYANMWVTKELLK